MRRSAAPSMMGRRGTSNPPRSKASVSQSPRAEHAERSQPTMEAAFAKLPAASTASKQQEDSDVRAAQSCSTAGGPLSGLHVGAMTPVGESGRPQRNRTAAPNASLEFEASLRMLTDMGFEAVAARAALGKALGRVEIGRAHV